MKELPYRNIPEGCGGTYTHIPLPEGYEPAGDLKMINPKLLAHIGTYGCWTCVGVYFPLPPVQKGGEKRCFLAHINAHVTEGQGKEDKNKRAIRRGLSEEEGEAIKALTISKLQTESQQNNWKPKDVGQTRMLLVCPELYDGDEEDAGRNSGWWVMEGIREFFGIDKKHVRCEEDLQGFIMNWRDGEVFTIKKGDRRLAWEWKGRLLVPRDDVVGGERGWEVEVWRERQ